MALVPSDLAHVDPGHRGRAAVGLPEVPDHALETPDARLPGAVHPAVRGRLERTESTHTHETKVSTRGTQQGVTGLENKFTGRKLGASSIWSPRDLSRPEGNRSPLSIRSWPRMRPRRILVTYNTSSLGTSPDLPKGAGEFGKRSSNSIETRIYHPCQNVVWVSLQSLRVSLSFESAIVLRSCVRMCSHLGRTAWGWFANDAKFMFFGGDFEGEVSLCETMMNEMQVISCECLRGLLITTLFLRM